KVRARHPAMALAVIHVIADSFAEYPIRRYGITASQRDRALPRIGNQTLGLCDQQMMFVLLNRKGRNGLPAVLAEDSLDVGFWSFKPVSQNDGPQNENKNVNSSHPTCNLQRNQEQGRVLRGVYVLCSAVAK